MKETLETNELQVQFANILQSASTNATQAKEFILEQAPDVVQQTLLWYGISSVIETIIGVIMLYIAYKAVQFYGRGERIPNTNKYKMTISHDDVGEFNGHVILSGATHALFVFGALQFINLTWLQIWIAPKLYLIEKASTLLK